jgi:Holliday junction DNA helicase RuvB
VTRERFVGSQVPIEEDALLKSLRPRSLEDCIGQGKVREGLRIAIEAARGRGEQLDHVLLHGPPGLGKTTLAHVLAAEMDANLVQTSGPALERGGDLMGILTNLKAGDILFIDEIHRLGRTVEEFLYPAMEDYCVHFVLDKGANARTLRYALKPFTLVGATTRAGLLSSPLRDRFGIVYHLDFYGIEEIAQVVRRSCGILDVPIDDEGAWEVARRSRGTPRIANRLTRRVRDFAQVRADGRVTALVAGRALDFEGVDAMGLDALDRELLRVIAETYGGGPVGIETLAATLNEEVDTLADVVEPYLLKIGFVSRTSAGRRITAAACEHLGIPVGPGGPSRQGTLFKP